MISSAVQPSHAEKISFIKADCSLPSVYPGGPFDIVFGAWLLNYAPDRARPNPVRGLAHACPLAGAESRRDRVLLGRRRAHARRVAHDRAWHGGEPAGGARERRGAALLTQPRGLHRSEWVQPARDVRGCDPLDGCRSRKIVMLLNVVALLAV